MKNTKRALRRHHRQRMIVRTLNMGRFSHLPEEDRLRLALRSYKHRQNCSCYMCGHRRKWWGVTVQEHRQRYADEFDLRNMLLAEVGQANADVEIVSDEQA